MRLLLKEGMLKSTYANNLLFSIFRTSSRRSYANERYGNRPSVEQRTAPTVRRCCAAVRKKRLPRERPATTALASRACLMAWQRALAGRPRRRITSKRSYQPRETSPSRTRCPMAPRRRTDFAVADHHVRATNERRPLTAPRTTPRLRKANCRIRTLAKTIKMAPSEWNRFNFVREQPVTQVDSL